MATRSQADRRFFGGKWEGTGGPEPHISTYENTYLPYYVSRGVRVRIDGPSPRSLKWAKIFGLWILDFPLSLLLLVSCRASGCDILRCDDSVVRFWVR